DNPSFEFSGTGWTMGTGSLVNTTTPRTGAASLQVPTTTAARVALTSQASFAVEEGEQYRLSFWVRLSSGTSANNGVVARMNYGATALGTNTNSEDIALTPDETTTTYVRATGIWTVPAGA